MAGKRTSVRSRCSIAPEDRLGEGLRGSDPAGRRDRDRCPARFPLQCLSGQGNALPSHRREVLTHVPVRQRQRRRTPGATGHRPCTRRPPGLHDQSLTEGSPPPGCLSTRTALDAKSEDERIDAAPRRLLDSLHELIRERLQEEDARERLTMPPTEAARVEPTITRGSAASDASRPSRRRRGASHDESIPAHAADPRPRWGQIACHPRLRRKGRARRSVRDHDQLRKRTKGPDPSDRSPRPCTAVTSVRGGNSTIRQPIMGIRRNFTWVAVRNLQNTLRALAPAAELADGAPPHGGLWTDHAASSLSDSRGHCSLSRDPRAKAGPHRGEATGACRTSTIPNWNLRRNVNSPDQERCRSSPRLEDHERRSPRCLNRCAFLSVKADRHRRHVSANLTRLTSAAPPAARPSGCSW